MGSAQGQPIPRGELLNDPELKQAVEIYNAYKQQPLNVVYDPEKEVCNAVCGPMAHSTPAKPPLNILLLVIVLVVGIALGYVACSYMTKPSHSMQVYQPPPMATAVAAT